MTGVLTVIILSVVLITETSNRIFANAASAGQKQQQLVIVANNTNNITKSGSMASSVTIRPNIQTDFNSNTTSPVISKFAYVDPFAVVIGDCEIGKLVLVASFAVCRGDEGTPIHIGDYSNVQEGVFLHALETTAHGKNIDEKIFSARISFEGE